MPDREPEPVLSANSEISGPDCVWCPVAAVPEEGKLAGAWECCVAIEVCDEPPRGVVSASEAARRTREEKFCAGVDCKLMRPAATVRLRE
jgi:hypothetical protein